MNIKFNNCEKFFGVSGYTSTSANYIANKAKEIADGYNTDDIRFITTTVKSLNSDVTSVIERGLDDTQFDALIKRKLTVAKLNGLISWMREAIKAKENLLKITEKKSFNEWMCEIHPDIDLNTFGADVMKNDFPEDIRMDENTWAMNNMTVKEINEYLYLLAACSTIGKFIHPNGEYARARKKALDMVGTSNIKDYQSSTVIYEYESSLTADTIENKFFELQELHREYQKKLNVIKFNIENEVQKLNDQYMILVDKYEEVEAENRNKIDAAKKKFKSEFNEWRINKLDEIRKLKIIIPNELKDIVDFVNNVQK